MHTLLHSVPPTLQHAISNPHLYWRLLETCRQVWVSFLWGSLLLSPGSWCAKDFCALQESVSPVLCKLWHFYGGVNGNLIQEGLCYTHGYCTQSPCPCSCPLLTCTLQETLKHISCSVSVGSLGPGAPKVCLSPLSISGRNGV